MLCQNVFKPDVTNCILYPLYINKCCVKVNNFFYMHKIIKDRKWFQSFLDILYVVEKWIDILFVLLKLTIK